MIKWSEPPRHLDDLIRIGTLSSDDLKKSEPTSHAQVIFFLLKAIVILATEISNLKWRPH